MVAFTNETGPYLIECNNAIESNRFLFVKYFFCRKRFVITFNYGKQANIYFEKAINSAELIAKFYRTFGKYLLTCVFFINNNNKGFIEIKLTNVYQASFLFQRILFNQMVCVFKTLVKN